MTRHLYSLNLTEYLPSPLHVFSSSPYLLRAPTPADLPTLAALMINSYTGTIDYDGETLEDAMGEVQAYFNGASGEPLLNASWLCFDGETLASAILISLWEGNPLVAYMMTAAAYKGQGLGHTLIHQSLKSLKEQNYAQVKAIITEGNTASEIIFRSAGFYKRIYKSLPVLSTEDVKKAIEVNNIEALIYAGFSTATYERNWKYAQDLCIQLTEHPNKTVRGNAVLSLAYVARIHRKLEKHLVKPVLLRAVKDRETEVQERAADAIRDINWYMNWKIGEKPHTKR